MEPVKSTPEINSRYNKFISDIVFFRFNIFIPIAVTLHLGYTIIDRIVYPSYAPIFWDIRCIDAAIILFMLIISHQRKLFPSTTLWMCFSSIIMVAGHAAMVYLSDGSSSRYYEGSNLLFLGLGVGNAFNISYNIATFIIIFLINVFAMLISKNPFNILNFALASAFMSSTALIVLIMNYFFREQHYKAFVRQEQLKASEERLAELYKQADKLSKTDELTSIHNRRYFFEMLEKKIHTCEISKATFYLVIFDVDHFKQFNDTHGHSFGDEVLVKVVDVVKNNVRANDFVGRYGGDEFVIYLDFPNHEGIHRRLTKISNDVKALNLTSNGQTVAITVSIGAAKFKPGQSITAEKLLELADMELFNVKETGRGKVSIAE